MGRMEIPLNEYLQMLLDTVGEDEGAVASYIPELAHADPDRLAIAVVTLDGDVYAAGDADVEFTIQSISKPFSYALAIADQGLDAVLEKIDVEPSGDAFNEFSLDADTGRPRNPMINAGAITAHALVRGEDADDRMKRILDFYSRLAGRDLAIAEDVFASELSAADRNTALAYMLRTVGVLDGPALDAVQGYTRQCAVSVTVRDLARMAAVLAAGGVTPSGERLLDPDVNRQVLSVMTTCGMYNSAGDWLTTVGIPAKSGVAGGVMGVLPGQVGIAVFSPRLDPHGNSSRGVRLFERMNHDLGLHLLNVTASPPSVSRRFEVDGVVVHEIAGDLQFIESERVLRAFAAEPAGEVAIVLDFDGVHRVNDIAKRMLLEGIRRLHLDGHDVRIVDPWGVLGTAETGTGELVRGEQARGGYAPTLFPDVTSAVRGRTTPQPR